MADEIVKQQQPKIIGHFDVDKEAMTHDELNELLAMLPDEYHDTAKIIFAHSDIRIFVTED